MNAKWDQISSQAKPAKAADANTAGGQQKIQGMVEGHGHGPASRSNRRSTPHPSTEKVSGAGPSIAEHSKDAKAPRGGRQAGAYVKDDK